eukprot:gene23376-31716_t
MIRQFQLSCKDRPLSFDFFQTQANSQYRGLSILVTQNTIQLYKHSDNNYYNKTPGDKNVEGDIVTNIYSSSFSDVTSSSPCQVIYYDCGKLSSLKKVQFQSLPSDNTQLIASTISSSGLVAIWDLTQHVKPICDYVNGLGFIDLQWSPHVSNLLACSADSGRQVILTDLRAPSNRAQQNSTTVYKQSSNSGDCYLTSLQWCPLIGSSHYLAGMQRARDAKNTVFVWDIRKGAHHHNLRDSPEQIVVPSSGKMSSFCWTEYAGSPAIAIGTATGAVEEWKLGQGSAVENSASVPMDCEYISNTLLSPGKKITTLTTTFSESRVFVFSTLSKRNYTERTQCINISHENNTMSIPVLESTKDIVGMKVVTNGQYSKLFALTADARLHSMDILSSLKTSSTVSKRATTKARSKFSISSLHNVSLDDLEKRVCASRIATHISIPTSDNGMPLKPVVVGPITFRNLIDFESLKVFISQYEGLKLINFDQFSRRITLQMMVPAIDCSALMRGNITYASFLSGSLSVPPPKQPIDLIVCFPIKFVNFWNPTFIIDNKTCLEVDELEVFDELKAAIQSYSSAGAASSLNNGSNSDIRSNSIDFDGDGSNHISSNDALNSQRPLSNEGLLLQIAKSFRKKIIKVWEDRLKLEKQTFSSGSLRPSWENSLAIEGSLISMRHSYQDGDSLYLNNIEEKAFNVPFPVISAGVFNAKGVLLCFGNAKLNLRPLPQSARVDLPDPPFEIVNKGPPILEGGYSNSLQDDKFGSEFSLTSKSLANSSLSRSSHSVDRSHKSYANYLVQRILQTNSNDAAALTQNSSTNTLDTETPGLRIDSSEHDDLDQRNRSSSSSGLQPSQGDYDNDSDDCGNTKDGDDDGYQFFFDRDVTPVPPSPSPPPLLENENDLTIADLYNEEKTTLFGKVGSSKSEKVKTFLSVQETSEDDSSGSDDDNDEDESEDEDADEEGDDEDEDEDDSNTFGDDIGYSKSHPISLAGELKTLIRDTQEDRTEMAVASTSAGSGNLTLVSSSLDSVALTEEYISPPVPWNMAVVDRILSGKEIKSTSTLSSGSSSAAPSFAAQSSMESISSAAQSTENSVTAATSSSSPLAAAAVATPTVVSVTARTTKSATTVTATTRATGMTSAQSRGAPLKLRKTQPQFNGTFRTYAITAYDRELDLARFYVLNAEYSAEESIKGFAEGFSEICRFNGKAAELVLGQGGAGITQMWKLLTITVEMYFIASKGRELMWTTNALGRRMLVQIICYLLSLRDIQTTATVVCTMGGNQWSTLTSLADKFISANSFAHYLDSVLYMYSEILLRWGMKVTSTEVRKMIDFSNVGLVNMPSKEVLSVGLTCFYCQKSVDSESVTSRRDSNAELWCVDCQDTSQQFRREYSFCFLCGHGGHAHHLKSWFITGDEECPTGCGCKCCIAEDETIGFEEDSDADPTQSIDLNNFLLLDFYIDDDLDAKDGAHFDVSNEF